MKKITLLIILISFYLNSCKKADVTPATPAPVAEFSYQTGSDGKVLFNNLSLNGKTYKWDFGNGETSSQKSPDIVYYQKNANFQVSLTVTGDGGSDVVVKSVPVTSKLGSTVVYKKFSTGNANIEVYVDGSFRGTINGSYYYNSGPGCGNQYSVTVSNLTEGSHRIEAREVSGVNRKSWNGTTNITGGSCLNYGLTI